MAQMTAVQITRPGGPFEVVKQEVAAPGANQVRIKVQACGICHSDLFVKEGHWPGLEYPRITGHEVAGVIDEIGPGPTVWKKGQRVGVGWHGRHCGQCKNCCQANHDAAPEMIEHEMRLFAAHQMKFHRDLVIQS